jgi:hypothetical protein
MCLTSTVPPQCAVPVACVPRAGLLYVFVLEKLKKKSSLALNSFPLPGGKVRPSNLPYASVHCARVSNQNCVLRGQLLHKARGTFLKWINTPASFELNWLQKMAKFKHLSQKIRQEGTKRKKEYRLHKMRVSHRGGCKDRYVKGYNAVWSVKANRHFGGICPLHLQGQNVSQAKKQH